MLWFVFFLRMKIINARAEKIKKRAEAPEGPGSSSLKSFPRKN